MKALVSSLALFALLTTSGANAALESRLDGQAVYDTDRNITWLANANLALTNNFGVVGINPGGYMSWYVAQEWSAAMNTANYLGFSNWRLPTALQPDPSCGYFQSSGISLGHSCTGSEMGHLFYNELGGQVGVDIQTTHSENFNLFQNIESYYYWSSTAAPNPAGWYPTAYSFLFLNGFQEIHDKDWSVILRAWAVRDGDVAAASTSTVPAPAAAWLLGSGLLGLIGVTRRKAA